VIVIPPFVYCEIRRGFHLEPAPRKGKSYDCIFFAQYILSVK